MADFAALMAESQKKKDDAEVAASAGREAEDGDDDAPVEEEESTASFVPKYTDLEEVEVNTGTEEETEVYSQRSKLYIYGEAMLDKGTGKKSWLERGVGEMKLLQHKETGRLRVLMRQEQHKKIIANFALDPRIELTPNAGAAEKSWVWVAYDFDGTELIETTFALKFGSPELAKAFKETFNKYQDVMKKVLDGEDAAEGAEEADEAADAIAALSTGDKAEREAEAEAKAEAEADKEEETPAAEEA
jgi:Ran-binding protein 1